MQAAPDLHTAIEAVSMLVTIAGFIIMLMIKNNQATVKEELVAKQTEIKEELVENQNKMREDMDEKHAENSQAIAVHAASDDAKFDSIARTLIRMDGKLDRLNGHT